MRGTVPPMAIHAQRMTPQSPGVWFWRRRYGSCSMSSHCESDLHEGSGTPSPQGQNREPWDTAPIKSPFCMGELVPRMGSPRIRSVSGSAMMMLGRARFTSLERFEPSSSREVGTLWLEASPRCSGSHSPLPRRHSSHRPKLRNSFLCRDNHVLQTRYSKHRSGGRTDVLTTALPGQGSRAKNSSFYICRHFGSIWPTPHYTASRTCAGSVLGKRIAC
jgi:hypothetical protein